MLREAGSKAAAEHRGFEGALKGRRRELERAVEGCAAGLAALQGRADIVKREAIAAEVRGGVSTSGGCAFAVCMPACLHACMRVWPPCTRGGAARVRAVLL